MPLLLSPQDGAPRFCKKCSHYKPPRSHHCRMCDRCVLRMDHHCPWVNNCIGHCNYKPFFGLLICEWRKAFSQVTGRKLGVLDVLALYAQHVCMSACVVHPELPLLTPCCRCGACRCHIGIVPQHGASHRSRLACCTTLRHYRRHPVGAPHST